MIFAETFSRLPSRIFSGRKNFLGRLPALICAAWLGFIFPVGAESPASLAGGALGLVATSGDGAFASSGYAFMTFGSSGSTWQIVNLSGTTNDSGNCTYSPNGSAAHLDWTDNSGGNFSTDFSFDSAFGGSYAVNDNSTAAQQHGNFIWFNGAAPASVAGQSFLCTVNDGSVLAASGLAVLKLDATGNAYTIQGDGTSVPDSSGTWEFFQLNAAVGELTLHDSLYGNLTGHFAFADGSSGSFGLTGDAGVFQVGDFTVADTTRPTISITTPANNQRVSNEIFSVTGQAADNAGVALVMYSLNGLDWLEANSSDNWSNWTADIVLNAGTNILQACAMDNSGNISATNTVNFYYVASSTLGVTVNNAKNKVSPNYNNALLEVGRKFQITAQPAPGFVFTSWTDGTGNLLTNQPSLSFVMQPGSAFTANFADVAKPTANILTPKAGQRYSNSVCTVTGRAGDNDAVAAVYLSVNGSGWFSPKMGTGGTNWSASAALNSGTNHLAVFSVDASGNVSKTNTVDFQYVPCAILSVNAGVGGKVTPALNGALVPLGQKITLTAVPKAGFAFRNWRDGSGNPPTNQPTLTFRMAPNLVFTASFVDTNRPVLTLQNRQTDLTNFTGQIHITGRASDNDAVATVYCNLNNNGWFTSGTTDQWSNWWTDVTLVPGTNWFYAVAMDRTGNYSPIRQLKIVLQTAPLNLAGLKMDFFPDGAGSVEYTFGTRSFGQVSPDANAISGAGNYTYTRLSPSSGRLQISYTAPPQAASSASQSYNLYFPAPRIGQFTSGDGSNTGSLTFTNLPEMTVTSLVKRTVFYFGNQGNGLSTYYYRGTNYNTNLNDGSTFIGRTLSYAKFSPVTTLLKQTNDNGTLFILARYLGTNYGIVSTERYAPDGSYLGRDTGWFGFGSDQPGGNAPAALGGRSLRVRSGAATLDLGFGDTSFSQQSLSPNFDSGVGSYAYSQTDNNTAGLSLSYTAPANLNGVASAANLVFYAPNLAYLVNSDSTVSAAVLGSLNNYANGSATGKTLILTNISNGLTSTIQPGLNGNAFFGGALNGSAGYSWANYSPASDMLPLNFWSGDFNGYPGWLQLNYDTASGGTYKFTLLDYSNNPLDSESGTFGQQ